MESRRDFLKKAAVAAAGLTIVPSKTIAGLGHKAPSDTMNIVGIGIGGKGHPNLVGMKTENIIGLCDIDWKYAKNCFEEFPDAKRYWDWRKMFDELGDQIDGSYSGPYSCHDRSHRLDNGEARILPKAAYPLRLREPFIDKTRR